MGLLSGWRTKISGVLAALVGVLMAIDAAVHGGQPVWLSVETYNALALFLGGAGLSFLRAGQQSDTAKILAAAGK